MAPPLLKHGTGKEYDSLYRKQTMLDSLHIVSSSRIMTFESPTDERIGHLVYEIERDGKLKNPLLAQPMDDKYLMLDDAAIFHALRQLKIDHIPRQCSTPQTVTTRPWQRIIENWREEDLIQFCKTFPRQITITDKINAPLEAGQAEIRFRTGHNVRLFFASDSPLLRADMFIKFCQSIGASAKTYRAKLNLSDVDIFAQFPDASAALFPPIYSLIELGAMAGQQMQLPQGLVRIDQPGRVLGIDYSLSILRDKASIEEKDSFLKEMLRMRMSSDRTAYYDGYVLMFNN